jgi:hypothetical protein
MCQFENSPKYVADCQPESLSTNLLCSQGVDDSPVAARVSRLDCRSECLLVNVKLACGSAEANGRI